MSHSFPSTLRLVWLALLLAAAPGPGSGFAADTNTPAAAAQLARLLKSREAILLRNGDLLYGTLDGINPASGVRWRHPDAQQPIEFLPESVTEIHFPIRPWQSATGTNTCRVQLSNNDELEGDLVVSDAEKTVLKTWYAG